MILKLLLKATLFSIAGILYLASDIFLNLVVIPCRQILDEVKKLNT